MCKTRRKLTKIALLLASVLVLTSFPAVADEYDTPADFLDLIPAADNGTPPDFLDLLPADNNNAPADLDGLSSGPAYGAPVDLDGLDGLTLDIEIETGLKDEEGMDIFDKYDDEYDIGADAMNVALPVSFDFIIDPLELFGRGTVYSDTYTITNHGDTAVIFSIADAAAIFEENGDIVPLARPFDNNTASERKEIYLMIDFNRDDVAPIVITDAESAKTASIILSAAGGEQSTCEITISGSINPYPAEMWENGDVKFNLTYLIETETAEEDYIDVETEPSDGPDDAGQIEVETGADESNPNF